MRLVGSRIPVPSSLNVNERSAFAALVRCCDPTHFRESDTPLLVSYIQATLLARSAAYDAEKVATWVQAVKVQAMLATRLRLAPQARTDPKSLARQQPLLRKPWDAAPWHRDADDHDNSSELRANG